jgi:hypothetical protein
MVAGIVAGAYAYWGGLCVCALSSAYFLIKSLTPVVMSMPLRNQPGSVGSAQVQKTNRKYMLLAFGFLQLPVALFLGVAPIITEQAMRLSQLINETK